MAEAKKDTIYIDADDDITAVIDKVLNCKHKVVAIVLPKHASVFQSQVNMKLLKKAADGAKKNIVLVTSDSTVMAIAGSVGVHVSKTPTSKPVIPAVAAASGASVALKNSKKDDKAEVVENSDKSDDSIELDNTAAATIATQKEKKKTKTAKIPDFSSFRVKMGIAIAALIAVVVSWYFGFVIMPQATVILNADVSTLPINTEATARVGAESYDPEGNILPAESAQVEKIDNLTVEATGEKNIGQKATGSLTLTNCINDGEDKVVPAGTTFSSGSLVFVTSEQVILPFAIFAGSTCLSGDFGRSETVSAAASQPGSEYNIDAGSYDSSISGISAQGTAMTGGTTENVQVVSQEDVDRAASELNGKSKSQALSELKQQLADKGLRPIEETLGEGTPAVLSSPGVGTQASEVSVTVNITYNLLGVSDDDLNTLLNSEVEESLGDRQQNVRDNGLDSIVFQALEKPNSADQPLLIETVATIGPALDEQAIKESVAGKSRGEIEKQLEAIDGVRSVSVEYSPVWITTTPKSAEKVTIIINEQE